MYRKILFISLNFFREMEIFTKAAILLLFSAISVILTAFKQPFAMRKLNQLELYSNLAVCVSIYAGALYIQEKVNDTLKIFLFIFIILVNLLFGLMWVVLTFELFFFNHFQCFFKYFPHFSKSFVAFGESFTKTKFEWNLMKYASNLVFTTKNLARDLEYQDGENIIPKEKRGTKYSGMTTKQLNPKIIKTIVKNAENERNNNGEF